MCGCASLHNITLRIYVEVCYFILNSEQTVIPFQPSMQTLYANQLIAK